MASARTPCPICADPNAYSIEQAYLEGKPIPTYSRAQVERHLAHVTDRATLQQVTDLASASGVAARLHQLAMTATGIMDAALKPNADGNVDARLALMALKEARATLAQISTLTGALEGTGAEGESRPDLDEALSARLGVLTGQAGTPSAPEDRGPRALGQ